MGWTQQTLGRRGQFVFAEKIDGVWIDPFGTVNQAELLERVREYASGWTPLSLDLDYGIVFGLGAKTHVFGKLETDLPASVIASQVGSAFDSFAAIAASDFTITFSDSLQTPVQTKKSEWSDTLQLIAIAVIVVGVVWGIKQLREISE